MNRPVVSSGLFVEDEGVETIKPCPPLTKHSADHLEKAVRDAQVPGASKLSDPMVTGVSTDSEPSMQSPISLTTSLLTTIPSLPLPREDEGRETSIRNSNAESALRPTDLSESVSQNACNDATMLIDESNIADVQMKDI